MQEKENKVERKRRSIIIKFDCIRKSGRRRKRKIKL